MKLAYIITAYKNPAQLYRLIKRLYYKDVSFFIHVDKKSKIQIFKNELSRLPSNIQIEWIKRECIHWGGFGIVKAILNSLSTIIRIDPSVNYIVLLSEKDYPIKSVQYINSFFENNIDMSFMDSFPFPQPLWQNGGMDRIQKYHFRFLGKHYEFPREHTNLSIIQGLFSWLFGLFFPKTRTYPEKLIPYGGSGSWCINSRTARYILEFITKRPDYYSFHRYTHAPDEGFFQTILMNSPTISNSIVNEDLHFVEWSGKPHPQIFSKNDFSKLANTNKLYARKFDIEQDSSILDMIDEKLLDIGNREVKCQMIDNTSIFSGKNNV